MSYIEVRNLTKTFGAKGAVVAVERLSLEVAQGELVTLLGPSGCGKTTTLRCIAGLERPDEGEILIGGEVMFSSRRGLSVPPERREMGMVFQSYAVWPHMSVYDNIAYPLRVKRRPRAEVEERVQRALALVALSGLEGRYPTQLSGGQQQRVALARAIVAEPRALLFDEPLSNLDAKLRERMRFELVSLQKRLGHTAIYVTHDQLEAMVIADRIVVMHEGRIQQVGSPQEIYERPANQWVADFIGIANFLEGKVVAEEMDGQVRVVTRLGEVRVASAGRWAKGQGVVLSVRPESIVLYESPQAGAVNQWVGRVQKAAFLGEHVAYVLEVDGVALRAHANPAPTFREGHQVVVHLVPERCVVFEEAEARAAPRAE